VSQLELDTSLSDAFYQAMDNTTSRDASLFGKQLAFRIGAEPWTLVEVDSAGSVAVTFAVADPAAADARVTYRSDSVFEALMDERSSRCGSLPRRASRKHRLILGWPSTRVEEASSRDNIITGYSSAVAVATGRLRVSGSVRVASASESLFDAAEGTLRAKYAVGSSEAAAERRAAALEALDERLRAAAARPRVERWRARHLGTDQQVGAALLALGSALYVWYTLAAIDLSDAVDLVANQLHQSCV